MLSHSLKDPQSGSLPSSSKHSQDNARSFFLVTISFLVIVYVSVSGLILQSGIGVLEYSRGAIYRGRYTASRAALGML